MLAHELYHLLYDASDRRMFGECTSDWSPAPTERVANAFAAELLLPETALPRAISHYWTRLDEAASEVAGLCETFGVGWELAVRQLQNRRKLPEAVVSALLGVPRRPAA